MLASEVQGASVLRQAPLYPFLAHPPPQKKRPTVPLPSPPSQLSANSPRTPVCGRRRSATTSGIATWVASVLPGSPPPYTPRRSPISPRRVSAGSTASSRIRAWAVGIHPGTPAACSPQRSSRGSVRHVSAGSIAINSGSIMSFVDAPFTSNKITPSLKDFKHDLTAIGYTSIFVSMPLSPPNVISTPPPMPSHAAAQGSKRGLKSFRSLTALKPTRRSRSRAPPSPLDIPHHVQTKVATLDIKKKPTPKYKSMCPAPLATDLAIAQLLGGGTMDELAHDFTHRQAKRAGAVKEDGLLVGVGDVYRDGAGNIWMDREEMQEHEHLLAEDAKSSPSEWEQFVADVARRESLTTQDSDLHPRFAMGTETDTPDDLAAFTRPTDRELRKPGMTVLAIPSRSRRAAKHLRKPEFLLNVFPVPRSPGAGGSSPRIAAFRAGVKCGKGRRPAPLKLIPPGPASKLAVNPDEARRDFIDNSFAPQPRSSSLPAGPSSESHLVAQPVSITSIPGHKLVSRSPFGNLRDMIQTMGSKMAGAA